VFDHFVAAQDPIYDRVQQELRNGRKRSHWMWFIFPQLAGLGTSFTAERFGLRDLEHAQAYARHRLLGERLRECVSLVNAIERSTPRQIFGYPDDLKFRSCLTLFSVATEEELFRTGLDKFYRSELDPLTIETLGL
jgi:uncharacterized protein (DUF1810 family)